MYGDSDGCDNVHPMVGAPPPGPDDVPVEPPPTECGDGSDSDGTPYQPYMPVTTIPWINRWKGMNAKNLTRDLADMVYRPFEVSQQLNFLCIFIVFQVIFHIICTSDTKLPI